MLKRCLQYLTVVCITLLGLEFALRISATFPSDAEHFVYDENTGYRARPNMPGGNGLTTNSRGFNDIDHAAEPKEGSFRVAVVGDSFVHGSVPRDKNFTFLLQELARQDGIELEVMNMGINAAGPKNYLGLFRQDVAESNSDLVAVCIFIGNDITQSHPHFRTSIWLNSTRETLVEPYYIGASWEYSYIYRSIRSVARVLREQLDSTPREGFTRDNFMAVEMQRALIYQKDMSGFVRDSYEATLDVIEEMSEAAARQDKKLLIILAPDEVQVSAEIQDYLATHYRLDPREYDFGQPQSILSAALTDRGIAVLDLLPFFQDAGNDEALYLKHNTHWNAAGNRLAAEAIWSYINEQSLL